jgi:hypothetical protein
MVIPMRLGDSGQSIPMARSISDRRVGVQRLGSKWFQDGGFDMHEECLRDNTSLMIV